jgi:hypothetical protein
MDGFKGMVKMKTGGSVSKAVEEAKMCNGGKAKYKTGGKVHDDEAQDKALIKKELGKFAKAEDKGEKVELKLKSGGRAKKAAGTVKKYKAGGAIEMKKTSGDKDTIKKVKATDAKKADAPSKGAVKPAFKGSDVAKEKSKPAGEKDAIKKVKPTGDKKADAPSKGAVKKADGGAIGAKKYPVGEFIKGAVDKVKDLGNSIYNYYEPKSSPDQDFNKYQQAQQKAREVRYQPSPENAKFNDDYKKGGKIKKMADGGSTGYGRGGAIGSQSPIPPSIAAQLMQAQEGAALRGPTPSPMGSAAIPGDNPVVGGGQGAASNMDAAMGAQPFNAYQNFRRANPNARPGMTPQQIQQLLQSPAFQQSNRNFTDR